MMTTAIMNMKGGTAKTISVIQTAAILFRHGKRVLLIDADSQANLSEFIVDDPENLKNAEGLCDLLCGGNVHGVLATKIPGAQLLPGDSSLMALDIAAMRGAGLKQNAIADWLQNFPQYDHCLIDCPPAFNAAAMAALRAADNVIIPVKLDAFGINGIAKILEQIRNMQEVNPKLKIAGVLPTMYYRSETQEETEAQLQEVLGSIGVNVFSHIRRSPKVDESTFEQLPLTDFSPKSGACRDYQRFVDEFLKWEV